MSQTKIANLSHMRRYSRPYLLRHLLILVITGWLFFGSILTIGLQMLYLTPRPAVLGSVDANARYREEVETVQGLLFAYFPDVVNVSAFAHNGSYEHTVSKEAIKNDKQLSRLVLTAQLEQLPWFDRAAQLSVYFHPERAQSISNTPGSYKETIAEQEELIGELLVKKLVYKNIVEIGGESFQTHTITWSGKIKETPFLIELSGLNNLAIPSVYEEVLATFGDSTTNVLGSKTSFTILQSEAEENKIARQFQIDAVSPAVVKIYNVTCGALLIEGREASRDTCDASTGSGFFISSNGHIATNGHVVTYDAEDALVSALLKNPESLPGFLRYIGLSDHQIMESTARPELLAAAIAKIYDAPADVFQFKDKKNALVVALGTRPLNLASEEDARSAVDWRDSDYLKKAEIIARNYSAKDIFVIESDSESGFSSSDVAIIKVNAANTPYLRLYDDVVSQNQVISIIGFPGDADNQLTDNNSISPTVTNGTISAIRLAAGSNYQLYQSDADASRGSSGGPVLTEDGQVLGLLTYRFKSDREVDAAKSYIRDIADVRTLAKAQSVSLQGDSETQSEWEQGLSLYSKNHFKKALATFGSVQELFPAHRLAEQYKRAAEEAIAAGRDVPAVPLWVVVTSLFVGATGAGWAVILVARHHHKHHLYKHSGQISYTGHSGHSQHAAA